MLDEKHMDSLGPEDPERNPAFALEPKTRAATCCIQVGSGLGRFWFEALSCLSLLCGAKSAPPFSLAIKSKCH